MIRLVVVAAAAIGLILFVAYVASRLVRARTRGMSIRLQVFLALAAIVGTFAFGLGLMVIDRIEARTVRFATQSATDESRALARILSAQLEQSGESVEKLAENLDAQKQKGAGLKLELFAPSGKLLFPGGPSAAAQPDTVFVDSPIIVRDHTVATVRVVKRTIVIRRMLEDFAPTVLVISLVLGAAAAVAAGWIGRSIARPIEALTAFSERVADGERTAAPPRAFGREVTALTQSIDSMRRQLEGRPFVETFAADLSHELKNPVAAIRASAELLEEGALDEPEDAQRFVRRIREATGRIERLLGDLLSLARIEARGVNDSQPVDMKATIRTTLEGLERRDRIAVAVSGDVRVKGDEAWLARAIVNLLENALVHSPADSVVDVSVGRRDSDVLIDVSNAGAIPKPNQRRIFRRFVTTRADRGGSGLGLSIISAVAEAHGGTVELVSGGPDRVAFRLALPAAFKRASDHLREAVTDTVGDSHSPRKSA